MESALTVRLVLTSRQLRVTLQPSVSQITLARRAVGQVFFVNGSMLGMWAANIPLIKERLGLDARLLSFGLFAAAFGSLVGMPFGGKLIAQFGSALVTLFAGVAMLLLFPMAMLAPSYTLLLAVLVAAGMSNGVIDVAMNAHGALVEKRIGKPVMSSFHGMWSVGGLFGSGLVLLTLNILGNTTLILGVSLLMFAMFLAAYVRFLSSTLDRVADAAHFALPSAQTLALGSIAFLGMLSEGAILDWSGVYLRELAASPSFAASGVAGFSGTMAFGRFFGDGLRARYGAAKLVRGSAVISLIGLVVALAMSNTVLAACGFAIMGFGIANIAPVVYGAAGRLKGVESGVAIASVLTMGYAAFLLGPPVIGFIAQVTSLPTGLGLIGIACVLIVIFAGAANT